jgi:LemA protein
MKKGVLIAVAVIVGFGVIFGGCLVSKYNSMVDSGEEVDKAWSDIDAQLQRRADLVPNLVATVKGIAGQEQEVFGQIAQARSALLAARGPAESAEANQALSSGLGRLLAIAENYPQLRSSENFRALQDQLEGTENRISVARQRYNEAATAYNRTIKRFPNSMLAGMFGFDAREYFEAEAGAKEVPKVDFGGGAAGAGAPATPEAPPAQ